MAGVNFFPISQYGQRQPETGGSVASNPSETSGSLASTASGNIFDRRHRETAGQVAASPTATNTNSWVA